MNKLSETPVPHESDSWFNWCRLCAKQQESNLESVNIFTTTSSNIVDSSLATAIGKYFWVNIKMEDHVPKKICVNCYWLIKELLSFTERVNKVQAMYCLLENVKPLTLEHAKDIRKQCGLINENWQHIVYKCKDISDVKKQHNSDIKNEPKIEKKPNVSRTTVVMNEDSPGEFILINEDMDADTTVHLESFVGNYNEKSQEFELMNQQKKHTTSSKEQEHELEEEEEERGEQLHQINDDNDDHITKEYVYEIQEAGEEVKSIIIKAPHKELQVDKKHAQKRKLLDDEMKCAENKKCKLTNIENNKITNGNQNKHDDDDIELTDKQMELKLLRNVLISKCDNDNVDEKECDIVELRFVENLESIDDGNENDNDNVSKENDESDQNNGNANVNKEFLIINNNEENNSENSFLNADKFAFLNKRPRGRPTNSSRGYKSNVRYTCSSCNRKYKNPNIYRKHMKSVHKIIVEPLKDYMCNVCNKNFGTESRLKKHLRSHLPDEKKYTWPCPHCDRKFSQIGSVRMHVSTVHEKAKPFICDECGRACKTLAALNEHKLVHTTECPFECQVCKKRFKNKARLKTHMDIHAGEAHVCPDCGLKLNTRRTLQAHRLVHTDVKRYKCQFCEAAFKRVKAFKNHLILHTGMRPYKCNFCGRTFTNGSNCRSHKRKSHPEELAALEAQGEKPEPVIIPKLEDLKSVKNVVVQPRKMRRHNTNRQLRSLNNVNTVNNENNESQDEYNCEDDDNLMQHLKFEEAILENDEDDCDGTILYEYIEEI